MKGKKEMGENGVEIDDTIDIPMTETAIGKGVEA